MYNIKVKKPNYVLVGSDFSAQEVRMGAYASQDQSMIGAYNEGKDLYALIASAAFDMPYEQCLEFFEEGKIIDFEGEKVICGNEKEYLIDYNNGFELPYYRLISTPNGYIQASNLNINDTVITDEGTKTIKKISTIDNITHIEIY